MKLINTKTFELEEFLGSKVPSYAILSHTWGSEEVSIQEWEAWLKTGDESVASKAGFLKIIKTCRIAADSGIGYAWVDTNCIDKSSSAELTEAINSMLAFYRDAVVCYAHLSDYESDCLPDDPEQVAEALSHCRWFSRGWTLQELLAPENLILFSSCWTPLGSKKSLLGPLSLVTKIDSWYLEDFHTNGRYCSIARKMSWASRRQTTRPEDLSYCLIGLFDISMPLLYGEGDKAFRRLQEEIMKVSTDHTIFAWEWPHGWLPPMGWVTFLAPSPAAFRNSGNLVADWGHRSDPEERIFSMTNYGLSLNVHLLNTFAGPFAFAVLFCRRAGDARRRCAIPVVVSTSSYTGTGYMRPGFPGVPIYLTTDTEDPVSKLYIPRKLAPIPSELARETGPPGHRYILSFLRTSTDLVLEEVWHPGFSKASWLPRVGWLSITGLRPYHDGCAFKFRRTSQEHSRIELCIVIVVTFARIDSGVAFGCIIEDIPACWTLRRFEDESLWQQWFERAEPRLSLKDVGGGLRGAMHRDIVAAFADQVALTNGTIFAPMYIMDDSSSQHVIIPIC